MISRRYEITYKIRTDDAHLHTFIYEATRHTTTSTTNTNTNTTTTNHCLAVYS